MATKSYTCSDFQVVAQAKDFNLRGWTFNISSLGSNVTVSKVTITYTVTAKLLSWSIYDKSSVRSGLMRSEYTDDYGVDVVHNNVIPLSGKGSYTVTDTFNNPASNFFMSNGNLTMACYVRVDNPNSSVYERYDVTGIKVVITYTINSSSYSVNFHNVDGSVVSSKTVSSGGTLGTLPTISRNGYIFAGWVPCAPAVKMDGSTLDSMLYNGSTAYPLSKQYKYTNAFALHFDAYMDDWSQFPTNAMQLLSCTERGGWGIGYQANTNGHGAEIHTGSYSGIDLNFANAGTMFAAKSWHSFDLVFNAGTLTAFIDGVQKGQTATSSATVTYNTDNTIFVGAEAGDNATTPVNGFFNGIISNVFIANVGSRLLTATQETVINQNTDYYPVWRLMPQVKKIFVGNKIPNEIYIGNTPVKAVYVGTMKIWG